MAQCVVNAISRARDAGGSVRVKKIYLNRAGNKAA